MTNCHPKKIVTFVLKSYNQKRGITTKFEQTQICFILR